MTKEYKTRMTTMGELKPGDKILGADGTPVTVTNTYEKHLPKTMYEIEMEDGEVAQASGNHLWYCETTIDKKEKSEYERLARAYFENKVIPNKESEDVYAELKEIINVFGEDISTQLFIEKVAKSLGHSRVGPHLIIEDDSAYKEDLKYYSYNNLIDFIEEMKKALLDNEGYFFFGQVRETDEIARLIDKGLEINIPHKKDIQSK